MSEQAVDDDKRHAVQTTNSPERGGVPEQNLISKF